MLQTVYAVRRDRSKSATPGNSHCKYTDDTYLIVPASNEASRSLELHNIQPWAQHNNLKLNCAKSCEVVFVFADPKRKRQPVDPLPGIPGI